jgi:ferredoxin
MIKRIAKSDIKKLLRQATKIWQTYVPVQTKGGDTLFTFLPKDSSKLEEALDKINLKDEWVVISPKDIFFPQLETIFKFDKETIEQELDISKKLIFGVRPCDTKGILFSDGFFKRNFEDIYYLSRTKGRLIVTIGCLTPPRPDNCFCTSAETGPFIEDGYDLQLVDAGDSYFVEIGSKEGREFVDSYPNFFRSSVKDDLNKIKDIKSKAFDSVKLKVDFKKALELMAGDKVFEENYKRIGERCIYCGACLYTCPTCTCFNVFDDKKQNCGVRKRNWDACVFGGYTREASGHNPRDKKWVRTARRYEHKLKYDYKITGMSGCVACGRCLASCPVEIGMSEFIEEITIDTRKV